MGVIDTVTANVSCPKCNIHEKQLAHEKGSVWGSDGWNSFDEFKNFDVVISSDQYGPSVTSATCKQCGGTATVS